MANKMVVFVYNRSNTDNFKEDAVLDFITGGRPFHELGIDDYQGNNIISWLDTEKNEEWDKGKHQFIRLHEFEARYGKIRYP